MSDLLQNTVFAFVEHFKSYTAWFAFFAAFSETLLGLGFLIPGSTLLLFMGLLAGQGYLDIETVLIFAVAGAYTADVANYLLGRRYGVELLKRAWLHISDERVDSAHRFLNSHGAKSVFIARFLPAMKESIPFLAGSLRMDPQKFLIWDFLGAVGWSLEFIGVGYIFSASLSLAQIWLSRTVTFLALLAVSFLILFTLKRFIMRSAPVLKSIVLSMGRAFLSNPYVKSYLSSHSKTATFLQNRFDRRSFYGLTLTLFTLLLILFSALLGGVAEDLLSRDPIVYADRIVANLVQQWRTPELTRFFTWVTYLGKIESVALFCAAATVFLILYGRYRELIALYFSLLGSALLVYGVKLLFQRQRPETALYYEPSYSFPSAHALLAVTFYGFLAYLIIRNTKSLKMRVNTFFAALSLALLIGVSRIYLGEHYLSDVYGGYLLGLLWVSAAAALLEWMTFTNRPPRKEPLPHAKPLSAVVVLLSVTLFAFFGSEYRYKPAPQTKKEMERITEISEIFSDEESRFTRNIFGIESLPVNLVLVVEEGVDICKKLESAGWKDAGSRKNIDFPLFWRYETPSCSLYEERNASIYILRLWDARMEYAGKRVYVATADAVKGFNFGFYPLFTEDLNEAEAFAVESIGNIFPKSRDVSLQIERPSIKERLFEQPYFYDGEPEVIITADDSNLSYEPGRALRKR